MSSREARRRIDSGYWKARYALAEETLAASGRLRLVASGTSMFPAIQAGDVLTFRARGSCTPKPGQVVLYRRDGRLVAHRLRARAPDGSWIIRGDASPDLDDPPVADQDLLGMLVAQRRGRRTLELTRRLRLLPYPVRWLMLRSSTVNRLVQRGARLAGARA